MMALYEPRLLLSAVLLCVTACQVAGPTAVPSESIGEERSAPIAGLEGQVITDDYAVYAKSTAAADAIRVWLDHQLAAFRSTHSAALKGKGLVFAMEHGVELPPTIENWRKRYVNRSRPIEWTSPIRSEACRERARGSAPPTTRWPVSRHMAASVSASRRSTSATFSMRVST